MFYADDYVLHVQASSHHQKAEISMKIGVRPRLKNLLIISSNTTILIRQALDLEAWLEPSSKAVVYTWNFGDGSEVFQDIHSKVSHTFESAARFNVTVCANNTLSFLTSGLMVEVEEKISGLTVSCSGPTELSSVTNFTAMVATGTNPTYSFDFGDGFIIRNSSSGMVAHIYKSPGNYTVEVTALNSISQTRQCLNVEVYTFAINGVLPTECIMSKRNIQLTALVIGNIAFLEFRWLFGDGSPLTAIKSQTSVTHTFQTEGVFNISLTVIGSATSVSLNTTFCVEAVINKIDLKLSRDVVAVGDGVCLSVTVYPAQRNGYQLQWLGSRSGVMTEINNTQSCFVFQHEGIEDVSVMASNTVSKQTAKVSVTVQTPVQNISLAHDFQSEALPVNTPATFWVASYVGSNVSWLWDFGDGSPTEHKKSVSHVFTQPGQFTVNATAFNLVSSKYETLEVHILPPLTSLSLQTDRPYAEVGEETLFVAGSSAISGTKYFWTVDGVNSTKEGTNQLRVAFPKAGVFEVKIVAQNLVSRKTATILFEVFDRINDLRVDCKNLVDENHVSANEILIFIAKVSKGSNVTYHWVFTQSGINHQTTGVGETFQVLAKTPGRLFIHLRATNKVDEVASTLSLLAVQPVENALITTKSNVVALGKVVNISVSVTAGSDLQYIWYLMDGQLVERTQRPFILHTFQTLGRFLVTVSVQNILSQLNATNEFTVQEEIQGVDFDIGGMSCPFFIPTSASVPLHGVVTKGGDLQWNWQIKCATIRLNLTQQTFVYSFQHAGVCWVSLNISNGIDWQTVSHNVTVQDEVEGLILKKSKPSSCIGEHVTFTSTISRGTDVGFEVTFTNGYWIYSQSMTEGQCTVSRLPAGTNLVTVKAWNKVSRAESSTSISVNENIQDLKILNLSSNALSAETEMFFRAGFQGSFRANFTWTFHLMGIEPVSLMGQEVVFVPPGSGVLFVKLVATNGACSTMINDTVTVQSPVKELSVVCRSKVIFVGHAVTFSASVNGGSNLKLSWDFGDSAQILETDSNSVTHAYSSAGQHKVTVKVFNSVSHLSTQLDVNVAELKCRSPQAVILLNESTIFRSRLHVFEARVDFKCSAYKTKYQWQIFQESNCTKASLKSEVNFNSQVDPTTPLLLLPKHTLDVGRYCLVFTVSFQGTPVLVQQKKAIQVVNSPLIAIIRGGSKRLWSTLTDLILDGSESHDPDMSPGEEDVLQFEWTFISLVNDLS